MGDILVRSRVPDSIFKIEEKNSGFRLDAFLSERVDDISRSHFKRMIQEGLILVNERMVKPGYVLRTADCVSIRLPDAPGCQDALIPEALPLEILYEDDDILVVNKAPGMVVHPGAAREEGTLVHALLAHCPSLAAQGAPLRPGIVHRLDRDTSGAMVVAGSNRAYLRLIELFKAHKVHKEYLALVYGRLKESRGEIITLMDRHHVDRKKMAVTTGKGREAHSLWELEKEYGEVSLVKVRIMTGRTHQIRVHLSHMQHAVVGDETYGGGKRRLKGIVSQSLRDILRNVERQLLHAATLAFPHPVKDVPMSFSAPLPHDFQEVVDGLDAAFCQASGTLWSHLDHRA